MELEWDANFKTGNEIVDSQHQYFVDLINRVKISFGKIDDDIYKEKLISELEKYADFHFTSEENIATSLNLPGVSGYQERHRELLEEFNHHADDLHNGALTIDQFLNFLTDWYSGMAGYFRSLLNEGCGCLEA